MEQRLPDHRGFFLACTMLNQKSIKNQVVASIKIALLAGIVVWIIQTFPKENWNALVQQDKNWFLVGLAFLIILFASLISFWRWRILVQSLGVSFGLLEAIRLGFLGNLLNLVSVGSVGGDLFKAIEAAKKSDKKRAEIVTSVLVDRAIGLLGLVFVAVAGLSLSVSLSPMLRWIWGGAILLSGIGLAVLLTIAYLGHRVPILWINRIPLVGHTLYRVANACMVFQGRPGMVFTLLGLSVMVHCCATFACVLISHSLYSIAPTAIEHFITIPPALAAATLPLTPGGVGVQEIAIDKLFHELPSLPENYSGLIVAAVLRALQICVALTGALYYFAGIGKDKNKNP